ncbi:MAG: DUF1156 domain-containing protein [Planctomycetia bacterium]|nr:DUF1156 domain-containing protein [Planctomycetia bacterium]
MQRSPDVLAPQCAFEHEFPFAEVGVEAAKEKQGIRKGHPVGLHRWWARRPLVACRATVIGCLLDADLTEGSAQLIQSLCTWEASGRVLRSLNNAAKGKAVLDSFAGGGAIPLEALRCGCSVTSTDINPVAHLIQRALLEFPQRFSSQNVRSDPDYVRLLARDLRTHGSGPSLFDTDHAAVQSDYLQGISTHLLPRMSAREYQSNPLAADVRIWGHWVVQRTLRAVSDCYPKEANETVAVGYLWARAVECPNPVCRAQTPLIRSYQLSRNRPWYATPSHNKKTNGFAFAVALHHDFLKDSDGNTKRDSATCLACGTSISGDYLREQGKRKGFVDVPVAAVLSTSMKGKSFRSCTEADFQAFETAKSQLRRWYDTTLWNNMSAIPDEPLKYLRSIFNVHVYGIDKWSMLFNDRQLLVMTELCASVREATHALRGYHTDADYIAAVAAYLGLIVSRFSDYLSNTALWEPGLEAVLPTFVRQALAMVWDYCEINPFGGTNGYLESAVERTVEVIEHCATLGSCPATVRIASAERLPCEDSSFDIVITDPPYYDAVPYSDLSDFFYVWLKRAVGEVFSDQFRSPLTPKQAEIVQLSERNPDYKQKTKEFFETHLRNAFAEAHRVLKTDGVAVFMFAHRTTAAWETLVAAINGAGFVVTASWPIATEMAGRRRAKNSAALASSIFIACRKRAKESESGYWDDVRRALGSELGARLDQFWGKGIRGADFFISAIGPALSVFGKHERVTKLSGEEVTVGQFLDEVRSLVTNYALAKILKTTHTGTIDPESRFYVVWKWSYGDAKVPADESFKLAQALGIGTELMWDKSGVLEKSGENVQAVPVAKRIKMKDLGESAADGSPASLIDVLHRMCVFREKNDAEGMVEFLARSGQANNPSLWLVAQAVSEILSDGDKEKQLMQGLLNQKDQLETAGQGRLF